MVVVVVVIVFKEKDRNIWGIKRKYWTWKQDTLLWVAEKVRAYFRREEGEEKWERQYKCIFVGPMPCS